MKMRFKGSFSSREILTKAERAEQRCLYGIGSYTQKTGKRMIRRGSKGERSLPGQPPLGHANELYKNFIFFAVDRRAHLVVIGGALLSGTQGNIAPEKIEYGGDEVIFVTRHGVRTQKLAHYEPRPVMQPALAKAIKKMLPELLRNSIVR